MLDVKKLLYRICLRLYDIGTYKSHSPNAISCGDKKYYQLAYLYLEPGLWRIDACGYFPNTNATGIRTIRVTAATSGYNNVTSAPAAVGNIAIDQRPSGTYAIFPNVHFPLNVTEATTYRLIGYQSSGTTVSVSGRLYAVRIK